MKKLCAMLSYLLIFLSMVFAQEQNPLTVVRNSNQEVQNILKGKEIINKETEAELLSIINGVTDFSAISRQVIERFCKNLTLAQCEKFDDVFQRLLRVSSIKKMGRYRAERFDYLGEEITGNTAIVKTIAYYEGDDFQLNYHLVSVQGQWMVHNYIVDDVNTIRNYTKQFIRLFARSTYEAIIRRLEQKIAEYEKEY